MKPDFIDHYEALELSPNASPDTIERVFRIHAKSCHPDVSRKKNDLNRFKQLVNAYEVLREPAKRSKYDAERKAHLNENEQIVQGASEVENDCLERSKLLAIFNAKRRQNRKEPGVSIGRLEDITKIPSDIIEFHVWYFRNKGLISREEDGLLSITAEGVDKIEETYRESVVLDFKKIEHRTKTNSVTPRECSV